MDEVEGKDYILCKICNRKFEKLKQHLRKHKISIVVYKEKFPMSITCKEDYSDTFWKFGSEGIDYIVCEVCKQKVKAITNTHLLKHNLSPKQYKQIYPSSKTICLNYSIKITNNLLKNPPSKRPEVQAKISKALKGRKHSKEFKQKLRGKRTETFQKKRENGWIHHNHGRTWEQQSGKESAKQRRDNREIEWKRKRESGWVYPNKGLTYEEIYGEEKGKQLRQLKIGRRPWNFDIDRVRHPYNAIFKGQFVKDILKRDNYTCQITGMTNEEHKRKYGCRLHIHHWTYNKDETNPFYFITLSLHIHAKAHCKNKQEWLEMFNGIMEDKYCVELKNEENTNCNSN
jgi:hypothetical protein